ncbi:MAG: copper-binding protein [Pigmentiphaga sp.]|uniref:copper-binding protein n=1 Tax=Pigmentiphaga sp. TaxID=1977564 RepID=UPI0029B8395B|nr:copper-binding protein [Pigmentiphaga sp.]MDX3905090.1 copper-binding protein [Pigmentiphaga sp.]
MHALHVRLLAGLSAAWIFASVQAADGHAGHHGPMAGESAPGHGEAGADRARGSAQGEVRRVDLEGGRVTLRHGEIAGLDMPPMTMVFAVQDKRLLEGLKVGDQVAFRVVEHGGELLVTEIAPAP